GTSVSLCEIRHSTPADIAKESSRGDHKRRIFLRLSCAPSALKSRYLAGWRNSRMKLSTLKVAGLAACAAALATAAPALAHHAFQAEFDGNSPVMLQGKVTKVEWINPHTWVHMDVVTDGVSQEWMIEAGTPNTLLREGINRDTLKPGEQI